MDRPIIGTPASVNSGRITKESVIFIFISMIRHKARSVETVSILFVHLVTIDHFSAGILTGFRSW
jgi:hypothetical protein